MFVASFVSLSVGASLVSTRQAVVGAPFVGRASLARLGAVAPSYNVAALDAGIARIRSLDFVVVVFLRFAHGAVNKRASFRRVTRDRLLTDSDATNARFDVCLLNRGTW